MISIIIPAHNEEKNLARLLPKLRIKSNDNVEVIVALSCVNSDDSEYLAFPNNVQFLKCTQKGRAAQMNSAADIAKGSILVFLHADVLPPESFIEDILQTLSTTYDAGFFSYRFDKENFLLKMNAKFTGKDSIFTGGGDQCLFIKKQVFFDLGKFNETQVLMEDFELFDRIKKNRIPYKIVKNDLIVSARKYRHNSYARVNLSNLILVLLFNFGCSSKMLKVVHDKLIRTPYNG